MCYLLVARAKKRGFIERILGTRCFCSDYHNKHNNGTRITNKIIRRKLKKMLQKEIDEYKNE